MKIVTYNIQYGRGRDGRFDLDRIAGEISGADVIALQEVERFWSRSGEVDQPRYIASCFPEHYPAYGPGVDLPSRRSGTGRGGRRPAAAVREHAALPRAVAHGAPPPASEVRKPRADEPAAFGPRRRDRGSRRACARVLDSPHPPLGRDAAPAGRRTARGPCERGPRGSADVGEWSEGGVDTRRDAGSDAERCDFPRRLQHAAGLGRVRADRGADVSLRGPDHESGRLRRCLGRGRQRQSTPGRRPRCRIVRPGSTTASSARG